MRNRNSRLKSSGFGLVVAIIIVGVLVLVLLVSLTVIKINHKSKVSSSSENTYCNNAGMVCFTYPKSWISNKTATGVVLTSQNGGSQVIYSSDNPIPDSSCSPGNCLFTTASAVISNGFSNDNDIAGIFQDKSAQSVVPQYFLMSTTTLLDYGLRLGKSTDIHQVVNPTFINTLVPSSNQVLKLIPAGSQTFSSMSSAMAWLHSPTNTQAESIINGARAQ